MTTVKLVLAYDGTGFHGWARQPGERTVEGELRDALKRIEGAAPRLAVAGRTDAGVHAAGQVVSFETGADPERLRRVLNRMLAPEVVVRSARAVRNGFDARKRASAREYAYRLSTAEVADPFTCRFVWHRPGPLRVGTMRRAASLLEGEHDFASFCRRPGPSASTVRRLERLAVRREGDLVRFRVRAGSFLHQMVRSLVGTLVAVGSGKMPADSMPKVLAARSRAAAGPPAPAHGLTLERVIYGVRPPR